MSQIYKPSSDVRYLAQGPRGRNAVEQTNIYTVIRQMSIEADGRIRYRIKSKVDKIERVVTEEELVGLNDLV
jgi:hypothetical protein